MQYRGTLIDRLALLRIRSTTNNDVQPNYCQPGPDVHGYSQDREEGIESPDGEDGTDEKKDND